MSNTLKKSTDNQKATPNSSATPSPSSNTASSSSSSATKEDEKTVQVIIGEIGRDTKTGILGRGYSFDNGKTFHVLDTMYGRLYGDNDIDAIWDNGISEKVKSEVNSATAEIPSAVSNANEAVKRADSAVVNSKVNSDAIKAMQSAVSEAKSDAQNATNIANAMKSSVTDQLKNLDSTSKELDNARLEMTQYAKTAQDQGKDIADLKKSTAEITADVANTKGDVAELKITASATAVMASNNKSDITRLQVTASNASIDLQNAKSDIASVNATADKINASIKDQDGRISMVEQTAKGIQATIGNQQNDINTIKQDATGMKETITNNQKQLTEINTSVDGLSTKVAGAVGKDFVESSIKQANDKINETITNLQGNLQNVTADLTGLQSTVKDKADQSQITQLANALQVKLSGSIIAQATDVTLTYTGAENEYPLAAPLVGMNDVDKGSTLILSFDYVASADTKFIPQLDGEPWIPWGNLDNATPAANGEKGSYSKTITVNDDSWQNGNAKNLCIRCDGFKGTIEITNLVLKYADTTLNDAQSSFDMLRDDINLRVQKGDLISQINLEAGQTLIESKKLFLDADSVVFSGKAFIPDAAIAHLSLDKLTVGHITVPIADKYGNQIELGNDGINIISGLVVEDSTNSDSNSSDSNVSDMTTVSTGELTNLAASPATALNTALFIDNQPNNTGTISNQPDNPNSSSSASSSAGSVSSGSDSDSFQKIGYGVKLTANGLKMYQHRQYAKTTGAEPKSEDFTLLDVNPIKSPASNDSKKLPEGLAFMIQTQKYSSVLGPETPHNFLALGRRYYNDATDDTGTDFYDVVYSAEDGNGYPVGLHVNTSLYTKPYGADHGIRTAWVSWSNWDGGEKYPAIVQDGANWGGICFPKSGQVTLFDPYGYYCAPDKNTGVGNYNGYGG